MCAECGHFLASGTEGSWFPSRARAGGIYKWAAPSPRQCKYFISAERLNKQVAPRADLNKFRQPRLEPLACCEHTNLQY